MGVRQSVVGVVALLTAFAAHADIMTINPASFSDGTYISYATPGVTLSTMTLIPGGSLDQNGAGLYVPVLSPVYAMNGAFASSSAESDFLILDWGAKALNAPITDCLHGCSTSPVAGGVPSLASSPFLRVDFSDPVSLVSAIQAQGNPSSDSLLAAFNSAGQLVGECLDSPVNAIEHKSTTCISAVPGTVNSSGGINQYSSARWTVSDATADISTVIIGSYDATAHGDITEIDYGKPVGVPEPGPLGLMGAGLICMALARRKTQAARN